jgi:hypothetical protein
MAQNCSHLYPRASPLLTAEKFHLFIGEGEMHFNHDSCVMLIKKGQCLGLNIAPLRVLRPHISFI